MIHRIALAAALCAVALAGCSAGTASPSTAGTRASTPSATSAAVGSATLRLATTSLGAVVVDGAGRTVYVFDEDTAGQPSTCTGTCAALWPAITTTSASPSADGISGAVGTVTTADGGRQVTLDGLPLYTYAQDSAPGDVKGQGVGGTWWAVGANGAKVTTTSGSDDMDKSRY